MDVKKVRRYEDLDGQVYVIRELRNGLAYLDDKVYMSYTSARRALTSKLALVGGGKNTKY